MLLLTSGKGLSESEWPSNDIMMLETDLQNLNDFIARKQSRFYTKVIKIWEIDAVYKITNKEKKKKRRMFYRLNKT